jgi:UDP-N-acetylmuramyl tripeptide synthase
VRAPEVTFVIERDDPFLVDAVGAAARVRRVSFGGRVHPDAATCPQCDRILQWDGPNYRCECGLGSIPADVSYPGDLSGPARNAVLACEAAKLMGAEVPEDIVAEARTEAPDRTITTNIAGRKVKAKLAKNPESWRESLTQVACPNVVLEVNARGIDGLDTSWLWDVDYGALKGRTVVCTGDRRRDVAYRISVQGIATTVAPDREQAVASLPEGEIDLIASYTAFYNISTGTQAG